MLSCGRYEVNFASRQHSHSWLCTLVSSRPESRLAALSDTVVACRKCPRLVRHREEVARTKRRAYRDCSYWDAPCPASAIRALSCSSSAWRPAPMAPTAPAACSPAIAPGTFSTRNSIARVSPASPRPRTPATACNCATPTSPRWLAAHRPAISRCPSKSPTACHTSKTSSTCSARAPSSRSARSPSIPTCACWSAAAN